MTPAFRWSILVLFAGLAIVSALQVPRLKFSFDFEQFFPQGDPDLDVFREFIEEFESDDNFLLVALHRPEGVFDSVFLDRAHNFSLDSRELPHIKRVQSLTQFAYPVKTPFGITSVPAIHRRQPARYAADRDRVLQDERLVYNFISPDAKTLVVFLKTINSMDLDQAKELMGELESLIQGYGFENYHFLGRPYFQKELVRMQQREIIVSALVSAVLVSLILFLIFRKPIGIAIALVSIGLGMLLFVGFLGLFGRELNAMAALYPVLMIIVGTSDVIHIMSKYVDELRKGSTRRMAIRVTIREIGLATLLTSLTTAVGFASLLTSRIQPIRDFGINSAIGVLIAYFTVILFTTALLSWFKTHQIMRLDKGFRWEGWLLGIYRLTRRRPREIALGGIALFLLSLWGISRITTNYSIIKNMPIGEKITEDFQFFERNLTGFRPVEFAIYAQEGRKVTEFELIREIESVEQYLRQEPRLKGIGSVTALYKSIHQMNRGNRPDAYRLPEDKQTFQRYQALADRVPREQTNVLVSRDGTKARITSRVFDIGADSIKAINQRFDRWAEANVDTQLIQVAQTGTGLIIDKNAAYVRRDLLLGLGFAILVVSFLMALLFRNMRMLLISLVPNLFPLILAGALLGFLGIELEAGISIVFAVIFGIAVDDTIHFLSKYKLALNKGLDREEALRVTFTETGKAITLTSIILFFGFLVMLFSIHPPSVIIGLLISLTLVSALFSDLLLIPILVRRFIPGKQPEEPRQQVDTGKGNYQAA